MEINTALVDQVVRAMLCMQRHSWEQGVAAQALLEWGDVDAVILLAKEAAARRSEDGRVAIVGANVTVTDPASNGTPLLLAARRTESPSLQKAADGLCDYLLRLAPRTSDGVLFHLTNKRQIWVDSFYMAPPFLAEAGHYDEAMKQIRGFRKYLLNTKKGLYSHKWDVETNTFARGQFWGVGNGWAAAGMTRVIGVLPEDRKEDRQQVIGWITELLTNCLRYARSDGLFHNVIDDTSTFVETNLSQMLAYSVFKGVATGYLEEALMGPALAMREAAIGKIDAYGLVQGVCGAPGFDHPGTAPEGQAFFVLMESAYRDYL